MSKNNPFSDGRYVLRGTMTREQAVAVAEALAGSSVLWDRGHTFPEEKLFVAPALCRCGSCHNEATNHQESDT